jgi:hypothetical protein
VYTLTPASFTTDLQGRLRKATRLKGIEGFRATDMGLRPMHVQTWGAFVFIAHEPGSTTLETWLGEGGAALLPRLPSAEAFVHVGRKEYMLQCNWKVRNYHAGDAANECHYHYRHCLTCNVQARHHCSQCAALSRRCFVTTTWMEATMYPLRTPAWQMDWTCSRTPVSFAATTCQSSG